MSFTWLPSLTLLPIARYVYTSGFAAPHSPHPPSILHDACVITNFHLRIGVRHFQRVIKKLRSNTSDFINKYLLFSLRSSSSCLSLLRLLLIHSIFPSVTWFWLNFQSTFWQIQLAFLNFMLWVYFFLLNSMQYCIFKTAGLTQLLTPSPAQHSKTLKVVTIYFLKSPVASTIQICSPNVAFY
jgi:hypothetical protein